MVPLEKVTSLADFFKKAETNKLYRDAAIRVYNESQYAASTTHWIDAKSWIDRWTEKVVGINKRQPTCKQMVDYLNRYIG